VCDPCWSVRAGGVARRLLVMRRSWVRFPQAAPSFVQVRATFRVLRADPSPPAWDGDRPRARARARQRRTPRFAYFIGVSPPARVHHPDMRTSTGTRRLDQNFRICPVPGLPGLDREATHNGGSARALGTGAPVATAVSPPLSPLRLGAGPGQFAAIVADLVTGTGRGPSGRPVRGWQVKRSWGLSHLNHRVIGTLVR
jgi:hypothetical protein